MKCLGLLLLVSLLPLHGAPAAAPGKTHWRVRTSKPAAKPALAAPGQISVVNAASYEEGVSPGALATAFGIGLTGIDGVLVASGIPLPYQLGGVEVYVNDEPAPIFSVAHVNGQDQVSFQVPRDTAIGSGSADVVIVNNGRKVAEVQADAFTADPGIYTLDGEVAVAIRATDYRLITRDNPAAPGDYLILYTNGLGPVTNPPEDGFGGPTDPLAYAVMTPQVTVNGTPVRVDFAGLAPGFVGIFQVNIRLPFNLPPGDLDIQIIQERVDSRTALLPVE